MGNPFLIWTLFRWCLTLLFGLLFYKQRAKTHSLFIGNFVCFKSVWTEDGKTQLSRRRTVQRKMFPQECWLAEASLPTHSTFSIALGALHPETAVLLPLRQCSICSLCTGQCPFHPHSRWHITITLLLGCRSRCLYTCIICKDSVSENSIKASLVCLFFPLYFSYTRWKCFLNGCSSDNMKPCAFWWCSLCYPFYLLGVGLRERNCSFALRSHVLLLCGCTKL